MPAVLSLRWQTETKSELTIYDQPGIKQTVDGIFSFMHFGALGHYGVPRQVPPPPASHVNVVEITDISKLNFDGFTVTTICNTYYSWPKGSEEYKKVQAFSFKFTLPDYTLVYTGDTGPSDAVAIQHMQQHLSTHHFTPDQAGQLASSAKVKKLVITHMAPGLETSTEFEKYTSEVAEFYKGDIAIANDVDRFILR